MRKRTFILLVLDGWGVGRKDSFNPIYKADPQNIRHIRLNYPAGTLQASGIAVGLPWNEPGSSEVGHMTLGAGKVMYQDYPRISLAVRDKTFFKNEELLRTIEHAKVNKAKVNLIGLISEGSGHSVFEHLEALIELMNNEGSDFALHLFTDGVNGSLKSAGRFINRLPQEKIGSIAGRHFGMDSDLHWDRTKRAYEVMTGITKQADLTSNIASFIESLYEKGLTDEFINPTLINEKLKIGEGDGVIFFNFQEASMRQITEMFVNKEADEGHLIPENLRLTTFTNYGDQFDIPIAFPADKVVEPLGKVISDTGRIQLRLAETQKYAHVTYFFNGMNEAPYKNEYRVVIPSREEAKIDQYPEMRVREVGGRVLSAISEGIYDFILVNFANADMMAHVGNVDATIKAVAHIDEQVGLIMKAVLDTESVLVITSDHGNAEVMLDVRTGLVETGHNISPVPLYVVANGYERQKTDAQADEIEKVNTGVLSDVAPTILELMGIPKPEEMTGMSLLKLLR